MKGKRDSCGHEDSLRALLDAFQSAASGRDERSESELSELHRRVLFFSLPGLVDENLNDSTRSFHIIVSPYLLQLSPGNSPRLSERLSENVVRKFGRSTMNIGSVD